MMKIEYKQQGERTNSFAVGLSLPLDMVKKIDVIRGDVPRSIFVRRILERWEKEIEKENDE